jgi:hypothetical protein
MNIKLKKKNERPTSNIELSTSNCGTPLAYLFEKRRSKAISLFNVRCWTFDVQCSFFSKPSTVYLAQKNNLALMVATPGGDA